MKDNFHLFLFNCIAPFYSLFFKKQVRTFTEILALINNPVLKGRDSLEILDIGCGSGALLKVLYQAGHRVTGIDPAAGMVTRARKNLASTDVELYCDDFLQKDVFAEKHFDFIFVSYVLHGLKSEARVNLLKKALQLAREKVIIIDYATRGSFFVDVIEWLERGDYFNFVKNFQAELKGLHRNFELIKWNRPAGIFLIDVF